MEIDREGAGGAGGAALGFPQQSFRLVLPVLRDDRRGRRLRPLDRGGGHSGARRGGCHELGPPAEKSESGLPGPVWRRDPPLPRTAGPPNGYWFVDPAYQGWEQE